MVCERLKACFGKTQFQGVLILVLMEYGLRDTIARWSASSNSRGSLNPCFNGIWSASIPLPYQQLAARRRLNPCFNGIWSARVKSVKICMWALYDQKNRRTLKFWGKTCTSECKYTKVFWIDCTTCHLCLTILGFLAIFTLSDNPFNWLLCCSSASSSAICYRLSIPQGRSPVGIIVF